jgi:hypothetical protein
MLKVAFCAATVTGQVENSKLESKSARELRATNLNGSQKKLFLCALLAVDIHLEKKRT